MTDRSPQGGSDQQPDKRPTREFGITWGVVLGAAVGTALGVALDNFGLWLPIGIAIGLVMGAAEEANRKKRALREKTNDPSNGESPEA